MSRSIEMGSRSLWDDEKQRLSYLAAQLNAGSLTLVLGAGVSSAFGLPMWRDLIARLFSGVGASVPDGDLKRAAEFFEQKHCGGDHLKFKAAVREALYRGADTSFAALRRNELLGAIGALVMSSVRGSASTVVTFNLDDLLETYLEYHGFVVNVLDSKLGWAKSADAVVLHPHGVLPLGESHMESARVTLDQKSYSGIVGDEANPLRQLILGIVRGRTCLFIGLSGDDEHLDNLLVRTHDTHAARGTETKYWGVWFSKDPGEMKMSQWDARGIYTVPISAYEDLPKQLFLICQEAARMRERRSSYTGV